MKRREELHDSVPHEAMLESLLVKVTQIREGVVEFGIVSEIIRARVAEYLEGLNDV